MTKSSSPWIMKTNNRAFRDPPSHSQTNQPVTSVVEDLKFADLRLLPQVVGQYAMQHADTLAHYGLFLEYSPLIGLRLPIVLSSNPSNSMVRLIISLCMNQIHSSDEPSSIEI